MTTPQSIIDECFKLETEPFVYLYKLVMTDGGVVRMSPVQERTWLGNTFEEIPCHLTGAGQKSDGEKLRPRFSVVNPEGIFTAAVDQRTIEGAALTRYQILKSDLGEVVDLSIKKEMRISKVVSVNKAMIALEARGPLDGANFQLPFRTFSPPEFPHVRLR